MTRILVVDDDRSQAEEFGVLLGDAGCDVTLAGNGREALDLLRRDLPEVVLTDLDMPVMDGLELVQAIRRDYPALPVILMAAMGSEDVAAKALHHGAASYVVHKRPLGPDRLASTDSDQRVLAGQNLFAAGHVVGLFRSGPECGPFLSCGGCPFDRPSSFAGTTSLLRGDGCLLPGKKASP